MLVGDTVARGFAGDTVLTSVRMSPNLLRKEPSDTHIRLKVNRDLYEGEIDPADERHIVLTKHDQ